VQHQSDPDPLNLLPELAAARALFEDFLSRYTAIRDALLAWHADRIAGKTDRPRPPRLLDLAHARVLLLDISKIVERIERIRAADAISRADLYRLMQEMARAVETFNSEPDPDRRLRKIQEYWLSIRLP
jgi:hypothetical protein